MPHIPTEFEVETFSGSFVNVRHPDPDTIKLVDIAHALSNICRYGGHCQRWYSVAFHSVFCSVRVQRRGGSLHRQYAALHHDDSEAYLGDIPRPLKPLLGKRYKQLTDRMDRAIIQALDLPFDHTAFHDPVIKAADNWSLFVEARDLLPSGGKHWWDGSQGAAKWDLPPLPQRIVTPDYYYGDKHLTPEFGKALFLDRHKELKSQLKEDV